MLASWSLKSGGNMSLNPSLFSTHAEFQQRHIGLRDSDISDMLKTLGFSNLEEMTHSVVPKTIQQSFPTKLSDANPTEGLSEFAVLNKIKSMMSKNKIYWIGISRHHYSFSHS
jgi:glycine dehydrogenase